MRSGIGDRPKRREDQRFLTGQGRYLDDLAFDGVTYAVVLRSAHAHAEIRAIDSAAATTMPGVLALLTAADAQADGLKPLLPYVDANTVTGEPFAFMPQPLLAEGKVRYVGEPLALIIAESRDQALDAAEQVAVDYVPLPAVTTGAAARAPSAPLLSLEVPGNLCFEWHAGDHDAVARAFARAAHVVSLSVDNHRVVTNPMEPRGVVGDYDPASGRYIAYVSAQSLHATRDHAARALGVEPTQVRFIAPDVGAYLEGSAGGVQTFQYAFLPGTVYRIPAIELIVSAVFTNTAPIGVLRGPGYGEAVNIMERLVDAAARQCGFDRAKLRRRNMPAAAAMPVTNAFGNKIGSGAFPGTLDRALGP